MKKQTTDVFVVFEDLHSGTISTGTGSTSSGLSLTGTTYNSTLTTTNASNYLANFGTTNLWQQSYYPPQTYNEYWNFDEGMDLLWKSFFDKNAQYRPISEKAVQHPVDIQETDNGLKIEIAAVGLEKSDIDIIVDSETLRVAYRKDKEEEKDEYRYLHRSIKKAGFDIAWKVSSKYELAKLEAGLDKGLLILEIPFAKENKPKKIEIK
jgi:HSP20 family molecular chaperone IbpA